MISEDDLCVLDAVQINPRASWTLIGSVLGVDPVTVARRWARLHREGLAWVSAAFGPRESGPLGGAIVEIQCERGANAAVAATLARWNSVVTVQHLAGENDLFAILFAADFPTLSELLFVGLPRLEGVTRTRSYFITRLFASTGRWRLHALGPEQVRRLRDAYPQEPVEPVRPFGRADRALFRELSVDGRRSYADVGQALGVSPRTVQRRLTALMARREITFRCDVCRPVMGWPTSAVVWLSVPDNRLDEAGQVLGRRPEVRTCTAVTGERNLLLTFGLRQVSDLHKHLAEIARDAPYARILDRDIVLRQAKLWGRVLDPSGRGAEAVPIDPWATPASYL